MSALRIKLDENMHLPLVRLLAEAGHDVEHVYTEGLAGRDDEDVLAAATGEGRLLVTLDLHFSDTRVYPPADYAGILLLRARTQSLEDLLAVLKGALPQLTQESVRGALAIADARRVRVRRDPAAEPDCEG